jgi:hypothetical protein
MLRGKAAGVQVTLADKMVKPQFKLEEKKSMVMNLL